MALELIFEKDEGASWGFRLTGGAEYDVPLTVVKVLENSIAERGGLQVNDIIVRVNETATAGLTHPEAHDVLLAAGNYLVLAIRRGDACSFVSQEEESNAEVCNIMQQSLRNEQECVESDNKIVHFDLANVVEESSAESNVIQTKHISAEKEIAISVSTETSQQVEERKWSTFLQRPNNPKPVKIETDDSPKAPPYRVVIVKQKKKSPEEKKQLISSENILDESRVESIEISQETNLTEEGEEITYRAEITQEEEIEVEVENDESTEIEVQEEEVVEETVEAEEEQEIDQSIEEKLAEVQRQLAALSHLPSTIQSTINAVTQQLASIVAVKKPPPQEEDAVSETHSNPENDFTEQIITEGSISENEEIIEEEETQEPEALEEQQEEVLAEPEETEEEKEAKRIEQELFEKQQKEFEEFKQRHIEQKPLKPIDRPIILPGGRRWSQPDDACPAVRHPKMSDEKIANTIETFSEVLVGKAKGINFLKYQPPPKNLDYLQRSEVYRLVHDLEPPVRGISSRACKILAEQDYYQGEEEV